jgi:hypothetical protein
LDSWSIDPSFHTIVSEIKDDGLLGDNFAMSWAVTCANGVFQGQVAGAPELSTWSLTLLDLPASAPPAIALHGRAPPRRRDRVSDTPRKKFSQQTRLRAAVAEQPRAMNQ